MSGVWLCWPHLGLLQGCPHRQVLQGGQGLHHRLQLGGLAHLDQEHQHRNQHQCQHEKEHLEEDSFECEDSVCEEVVLFNPPLELLQEAVSVVLELGQAVAVDQKLEGSRV